MLKGLVNLFKCCKSQSRQNRETQESINYRETEKNHNDNSDKNYKGLSSEKSLTSKNTTENSTPNKDLNQEPNLKKNEDDIGNCNIHYQSKLNENDEENQIDNIGKQESDLVKAGKNIQNKNYASNENLIQIPKEKEDNENLENKNSGSRNENINNKEVEEDYDKIIVPEEYIREDEKSSLVWSKNGIIDFINKTKNLEDYTEIKTKEVGLDIKIRKTGSELNKSIYIVKGLYKVAKKEFVEGVTIEYLKDLIYEPELRMSWDDGYKEFKKIEGNSEVYVIRSWLKSPMFIISDRDVIDKRIEFFKGSTYYNYASSLNDSFFPEQKGVVRCKNYFNIFVAEQDEEFYYFTSMMQTDIKMNLPQSILNITFPSRLVSWYKTFIQIVNKAYLETKVKMTANQI